MRHGKLMVCLTGTAAIAALTFATSAPATGTSSSDTSAGPIRVQPTAQTVRLVTGDVVRVVMRGGRQTADVVKAQKTGPGSAFHTFFRDGDLYVVPASAVPYLGSTLDPALFDVTRLGQRPTHQLAATVHLRAGGSADGLPGFTAHSRSGSVVHGVFSSGTAFGAALARQATRDHASATHTTGLFRGVTRIAPAAGRPAAASSRPSVSSGTLTIDATDYNGNPDNGDTMTIYNVDDINVYNNFVFFENGTAQLTDVPDGHYSGVAFFYDFSTGSIYQVTLAQFTVKGDTTVSVDARDATSQVSITTPRPAVPNQTSMQVARADANGLIGSYAFLAGDQAFYVKPIVKHPSIGRLYYWVYTRQFSVGAKQPYTYDLKFGTTDRISPDQSYHPAARSLAAIDSAYYADHDGQQSLDGRFGAFPWEQFLITSDVQFTVPTQRTEYYLASNDLEWEAFDYQVYVPNPFTLLGEIDSSWRSFESGWSPYEPWGDDPSHPRMFQHNIFINQTVCPACLSGTTLDVLAFPFGDNSWQHRSYPDQPTAGLDESASWSVLADGSVVQQGTGVLLASANVGSASTYGIDYDTTRSSSDFTMSTRTSTSWTVPEDAPRAALPHGWTCSVSGGTSCTVLPVMTVNYSLPVDLLGQIHSGKATGSLRIGHLAHSHAPVASLRVRVSYDGGSTYQKVKVTPAGSRFTLQFTVPPPGQTDGFGSLSIDVLDANGSTLNESIKHAFAVVS